MKKDNLNLITRVGLIVGMLIISLSVAYYFVIFLPQREISKIELIREEQRMIEACLDEVRERFGKMEVKGLARGDLMILLDQAQKQKDECFKKYPVGK